LVNPPKGEGKDNKRKRKKKKKEMATTKEKGETKKRSVGWDEVRTHNTRSDCWLVIDQKVYDITSWSRRHPGGKVITHYAGEDATEPFHALHPDKPKATKYLAPLLVGDLDPSISSLSTSTKPATTDSLTTPSTFVPPDSKPIVKDFRALRAQLEKEGLFDPDWRFYVGMLLHILLLEAASYLLMSHFGTGWPIYITCALIMMTAQAQAGWLQHDFGHLSVFKDSKWNHWAHYFVICHLKGASRGWWNWRHFEHHAKPNVARKDPDISFPYFFVLGDRLAVKWAKSKRAVMPHAIQHIYWWLFPPLLLPVYFHSDNIRYVIVHRQWWDFVWVLTFFAKHFLLYTPLLGLTGAFWFYMFYRTLESHWFVWVTQMSHLPMHVDDDFQLDWPTLQCLTTCNVNGGWFNDWFTVHLNYQIEHHLFPTMPRHNYPKANKRVRELYKKHNVPMATKSLLGAFADIVRALEKTGKIWAEAHYAAYNN